ncbi:uncharacterized protein col6a3 [Alosa sapidissima]|uniref:uncharacterized protein col6a3 n=1 Tax=Alosa sapidissima TaxID=34773 RepID=UPI001C096622|nr:uncharacterized protein col6a3 [Alosa sapidissima]
MRDFVQRVVEKLHVDEGRDRVSVVQYSQEPEASFYLNTYTTKEEVLEHVRGLRHKGGRPLNTGSALQYVRDSVLSDSSGSRRLQGVPQILILLNGGKSSDSVDTPASALRELGVKIFTIGNRYSDSRELQRISKEPSNAVSVSDFSDLPSVQEQLLDSVETVVVSVTPTTPTVLVDQTAPRKDVVFLLDGSDYTRNAFPAMKDFVQRVVEKLNVMENRDRVSVVQYSRDPEAHFYLNTYTGKEETLDAVRALRHKGGRPLNTGAALQYVRDSAFSPSSGSRRQEGVPQILILLSGARSSDNVDTPATSLKESGVLIFAIGTKNSSREVEKISSDPTYAQSVSDFSELPNVQQQFLASVNTAVLEVTQTSPPVLVDRRIPRKDVVFMLDGSDGTRNVFPAVLDFVQRVVEKLNVGEGKDRVSVVQYSRDPVAHFYLNTHSRKEDVLENVRSLRHKGGRPLNTGAALQYVRENVFTASSGSRRLEGVPQMLILLSGGKSFDSVDAPASALKQLGVQILPIGSRNSDSRELQRISHDPSYAMSVSDFSDLPSVQQQLLSVVSPVVVEATPKTPTVIVEGRAARRDVILLLDGSDGNRNGFPAMRDFVQRVVEKLHVDEGRDRVSVVQYSQEPEASFYLNTYTTKEEVLEDVRGLRHKGGRPLNTGSALQYVRDSVLSDSSGSRRLQGVPQILILLNGGKSSDSVDTPASALRELGVKIFTIGNRYSDSRELQRISKEPSNAVSVSDFSDLPSVQEQLLDSVETVVVSVTPTTPTVLVDQTAPRKDVVFLLDGSDYTRNAFPAMKDFVQRVVEKLNVMENRDRVSVVQYSRDPEAHFYLNTYTGKEETLDAVRALRHKGGRPLNTGAALQYVRDSAFSPSAGSRRQEGVPQILILLSGARSSDNVDTPATSLKESGVLIFAIGTKNSSREVEKISSDPTYAQSVSDFSELPNVQQQFLASVNTAVLEVTQTSPPVLVDRRIPRKDVVFMLDGSDGTRNVFPAVLDFVQRVVEKLNVGEGKDRVSVVQYSRDPVAHFYLNTHSRKEDVLENVRSLRHKGGRPLNTGAALQYVRENVFTASSGSRRLEGVPQMLILLSGGKSFDSVDAPASALKQLGVQILPIGSRNSDSRELQRISHDPSYAMSVSDFSDLPSVQQQLLSVVSPVVVEATPKTPTVIVEGRAARRDVILLLDGSDGNRNGFPAMRDFVQRVVEKLHVDEGRDRVSVVQYSQEPEASFYLNTYTTKEEVLEDVRGLRHKGGRPLNTGSALQYVRDSVLSDSSGSRRLQGVPQILILLNGGRSSDNVDTPASALRELGVKIFTIGNRYSDSRELQRISKEPSNAVSVSDFSDLPSVQEQLLDSVETVVVSVTPTTPTVLVDQTAPRKDVVFLLDGSDYTRNAFPAMKDFVQRVVEKLNVMENRDRVSVVQYSRDPEAHFYLNTYTGKEETLDAVRALRHKGGRPLNTGAALQYVRDSAFSPSAGSRRQEGVPQILILLSGARSSDNVDTPATSLKESGVLIFAIGTKNSSREVEKISSDPTYAQSVSDFSELPNVQQQFLASVNTAVLEVTQTSPPVLVDRRIPRKDVVFMLDGSDGTRNVFPAVLDFVQRVVEKLNVGEGKDRVSVVQYSRDPVAHFYLNTHSRKEDVLENVRNLRHKGGRPLNTGAALQYVRENVFTASSGSRRLEGVPQMLILLSGGKSFDSVDAPASALKQLGVQIIPIGSRNSDSRELQRISHDPSYAMSVSDFSDLPSVQQQLLSVVSPVVVEATPKTPTVIVEGRAARRDVILLLDGSDGNRNGFPAMRDFVQRVVEKLHVDEGRDRVSVVQYSQEPEASFYLNTYTTKEEVLEDVRGLRHKGGRPLNTGSALQYVRDSVLSDSSGSRRLQGVPQILILLNGGKSSDSVDTPASALRELGVKIFTIGNRYSDSRELQRISKEPSNAVSVSDFSDLPSVQEQLLDSVETVVVSVTPTTPTVLVDQTAPRKDVVFLLDGSDYTRNAFPAMKDFVQRVVEKLNVMENRDRVSVVQYSRDPEAHFYLNTYTGKEETLDAVRALRHKGGRPLNTGAALQYVRDSAFSPSAGSRRQEGVPQILILLSGARSSDNVDTPATSLKESGVLIFAIGTKNSSREVEKISSDPTYAQSVSDFSELPNVQQQFLASVNTAVLEVTQTSPPVLVDRRIPRKDVVFMLDGSDGTRNVFPAVLDFVQRVVEKLNVGEGKDRVSVVQYSRDPVAHFYLNTHSRKEDVLENVRSLRHKGGRPLNTGAALQYVRENVFTASSGSRRLEGVPQMLILLSGGKSFDSVDAPASALKQLGVQILPIGSRNSDSRELQRISHDPSYAMSVSDFSDLPSVQQQLLSVVSPVVVEATPKTPTVIVEGRAARRDVILLLDGSDGNRNGFPAMRDFVQRVVEKLHVDEGRDRVSVVQYSQEPEASFYLNTYTTKEEVLEDVRGLRHKGGRPLNTGSALQYVRDSVLSDSSGSRRLQGVPQILILLNGGRSSDNVDTPASALRELGVKIFTIGNRYSDSRELQRISKEPSNAVSVSDFSDLPSVQEQLLDSVETVVVSVTPTTPTVLVDQTAPRKDVVFLLDGSDYTRNAFPAMKDFVQRVVEKLNVMENRDRVSVVQYSRDPEAHFYLNTYTGKEETLDAVRALRHKGGRPLNTGAALQYVRDSAFSPSAGSRRQEGVPQILILLSGARSSDNVDTPATSLKESGVLIFAIGTKNSSREVEKISSDPTYAQSVSDFSELPNVQQQFLASVNTAVLEVTQTSPPVLVDRRIPRKDVVFMLDGSDGTRNVFPAVLDFVQRVVEKLNVGEGKDRVSVVQYSRDPVAHFYLNTHSRKEDVLENVRNLRHKGGRPLNTGAALQYVRENVFTASSGSRRLEGVPQMLILLSGGKSFDSVDAPASALKQLGVQIIPIGSRNSDSRELQRISHDPSYAMSVSDFSDLPSVQQQLLSVVSPVVVEATPKTPTVIVEGRAARRDVILLLDGSDGNRNGFPAMRDFVQRVVEKLHVDEGRDRVSVVQYSQEPEASFYLNTYTTKEEVLEDVRGLRHKGGRPLNTGSALQYVRDSVLSDSSGSRRLQGVPQILILLNGGRSSDSVDTPASALRELGVKIFTIGNRYSDSRELQRISKEPSNAVSVSDFSDLPSVQEQLLDSVETVVVSVTPTTPTVLVDQTAPRKDVVFLLDGSDYTRNAFPAMKDFVQRVVEKLNVMENRDRVSVVQYSRDPEAHFYLNTYTGKEETLDAVRALRHKGGRPLNTGAALQYVRDSAFSPSSGSRRQEGVPQILILLSGARSSDNVDTPATSLKESGVLIFAIGTKNSSREVEKISSDPTYAQSVSDFSELPNVQQQFLASVNTAVLEVTQTSPPVLVDRRIPRKDVVFMLDGSDGTRNVFPAVLDFVQRVVEKLNVGEGKDRVSVVQYSRDPVAHFYLNTHSRKEDVLENVRSLRHKGGRPLNTGAALQYVRENVFTASSGSRRLEGVPQMLILLSGGKSFDSVDAPASALKQLGVQILPIGSRNSDSRELQRISHDPSYAMSVSDFSDLPSVQQQLLSVVSPVVVEATPKTPTVIVEGRAARRDVILLLDGSDGNRNGFPAMRDFVQRVVEKLHVDEGRDRVSVVQYSQEPEASFYLNTYTTKEEVLEDVRGLRHKGGRPLNTGSALQYVRDSVLSDSSGSRRLQGVPQILILLNGGRSSDNVDTPASALRELGVKIFTIGNRYSDSRELQRISKEPSNAVSVSDFSDLPSVQEQLLDSVETVVVSVTPTTPTVLVDQTAPRKDVVFLLDGSDYTRNAFPAMKDFVQRVVEKLNVMENRDRVSVVQYSRDPEAHFYLNTYTGKEETLDAVRALRHKGGRPLNTGAALQYVRDSAFSPSSGSRRQEGVPQILILLSGARSSDNVDTPATSLKESGVLIFAIGTKNSSREVEKISSDPTYAQSVSDFSELPNVQQQFLASVNTAVLEVTQTSPPVLVDRRIPRKDVVFMLDGSDGTRNVFPAVLDFVQRVVEKLNVGEGKDRVSVVQYSRDPVAHFYLNTHSRKEDVLENVRSLRHKGGRPLNTGAALQYVRENVFTASSGSRRLEGVPQMLILLSGGKSFDSVDAPASALKQLGVQILPIGSRNSDSRELQRISHDPSYAMSVSDFSDLPSVQQQLLSVVSPVVVEATPKTPTVIVEGRAARRDVILLLDGSDGNRNGFPAMRDFVQRVVEKLHVDEGRDRVSVVQYSQEPEASFYLNTYTTKEEVLEDVRGLRHKGGRPLNTGSALQYVRDSVLSDSSGSRRLQGVPQILILLNGGRSSDNVDTPASALRELGVKIFTIGNRYSDSRELQRISKEPSNAVSVSDFSDLPSVQEQLLDSVETVVVSVTPTTPTVLVDQTAPRKDVVFLLDGSDYTRNAFPAMKDFVQRVVEKLNVMENRDRVSVVQYSRDPEAHFYLNTYTGKEETLDAVRALRHKGGRPLNTGAALQYVRDSAFSPSSGSRRQEGVPQILILLSGARSSDNVDTPATSLKESGVLIFAIGTKNSSREVEKISSDPTYAQSVSDFSELPNVQQQFLASVNTAVLEVTQTSPPVLVDRRIPRKDVVFMLDGSDGTRNVFPAVLDFVQRVVEKLNVGEGKDRVSVVQYSRDPVAHFYLNTHSRKEDVLENVRSLRHKGGRPLNTGAALQYVRENVFTASSGSRRLEGVPQMLILLSGGKSFDSVDAPASALKQLGVQILPIGSRNSDSRELQRISHDPSYAMSVSDFSDLPSVQQQLLSVVSPVVVEATPKTPTVIVEGRAARRDVILLLDGSDGNRNGFPAMRDFVQRVVEKLHVDEGRDRVSVVQYSQEPEASFYLNTYTTKEEVLEDVRGLRHKGGRPLNTGSALQYVRDSVLSDSSGSRRLQGVPQILILLNGGRSSDNVDTPASALRELGVKIFTIGNRYSDSRELQRISKEPSNAVSVSDFSDLPSVQEQLLDSVETVVVSVTPTTPTVLVDQTAPRKDVVFLLDGSDYTRNAFPAMKDFVQRVVEKLNVMENRDRVSVVQYSRDPEAHFYLNTYTGKEETLDAVRALRHKGGRPLNTGAALQYVRDSAFSPSSGSRRQEGVPQILILLSGARSSDNVDTPATSLKESGVLIFAIGTKNSSREVEKISSDPTYAQSVSDFSELPNVQQQFLASVNTAVLEVTQTSPPVLVDRRIPRKDVVFMLDGSDGTRNVFPAVLDFVQRVVEKLNVGEGKDRVSVVQYSRDPVAHFYLNTHSRKEDVLENVRSLRHKGGRPLNTGAALQYVRENVFTASSGSRRLEGVPQMLILLSGGKSFDSVDAPASALKQLGVQILPIGSRNSDSRELQRISHDPSYAMSVSDFSDLPSVQQQLLSVVSPVVVEATPKTPTVIVEGRAARRDVILLLDGSDGNRNGFPAMRDFVQRVVEKLHVDEGRDRVSVVQYSQEPEASFYLNTYTTKEEVLEDVRGLRHKGGRPLNTGSALQYVRDSVLSDSSGSRRLQGVPQILILLNGGRSSDNVDTPASALRELGVKIFTIGNRYSDSRELQRISKEPSNAVSVSDFSDLPSVQEQLLDSVETVVVSVTPTTPTVLVDQTAPRKDVVFLLDGSDYTRNAFPAMKDFVQRVVEKLNVMENRDRVSVVQYSRDPEAHFYLNTYTGKEETLDAVRALRHKGGRPLNTGAALQYVRDSAFSPSSGSRRQEGVPQILILLSGARSSDNVDTPATSLKESGVLIFAIGTKNSSREVEKISSDPTYAQSVSDFSELPNVQQQFLASVNTAVLEVTQTSPPVLVDRRIPRKDVVFMLDGSDGTRNVFPAVLDFVQRVVEKLNVGEGKDRVSVVQYSRDPVAHFYLNTHSRKEDVLENVRSLRHKGGRPLNTGAALQYVRENVFTASSGSRRLEGVPQMLILLSGGKSFDSVDAPASALKQLGVQILPIGSRNSDSRELQRISHDPSYAMSVSDFSDLPSVQQQLLSVVSPVVVEATPKTPTVIVEGRAARRDVILLLDGSDGNRNGFPAMRDFVQRVVEKLHVDEGRDRVSVVQYSQEPEASFYLNTYTTKEEVLEDVRGLRHKGGRPLNTGSALQYVRDSVLSDSSGSRRLQGVPQILILLNGGRSSDNVDTPASALRELGVKIFTIGNRYSDSRELQRISKEPSNAVSVSDFSDLPSVQEQLLDSVETVVVSVTPTTPTVLVDQTAPRKDVVFLLDGSDYTRNAFPAMKDFVQRVVEKLNVMENRDRVSVVQYSRDPEAHFYLNTYTGKEETLDAVRALRHKGGRPLNTGAALQYVRDSAFSPSSGSRRQEGVPQILILLSGARSSDNVDTPATSLKESGVLIFAIGTKNSSREVEKISSDPTYAQSVSDFSELPNVQQQFLASVNTAVLEVTQTSPPVLVDRRIPRKDVVFMLDGSDGTRNVFPAVLDFVQRVVEKLNVGEGKDRVSVVQYSRDPVAHFYLNTHSRKEDVLENVRSLRHKGGRPLNTGAALQYVRENVFTASSGSRRLEGVPQMLILLSGGKSFDSVDAPASALKQLGVQILPIGSRNSDSRELQRISHDPSYAMSVSDFSDLPSVQQQLLSVVSPVVVEATPKTPTVIVEGRAARRDVILLLDGSDGNRNGFPAMRDFVQRVVEKLHVDEGRDRVSVVQYSQEPEASFYLNTYTTKEEVLEDVRGLRHKGGRPLNTGSALQYVRDSVLSDSSGSRRLQGVPQILILLNGGRSSDNVDTPASALRELGVKIFTIGNRYSDSRELQRISKEPSNAVSVSDFSDLPSVQEQLLDSVETVVVSVTPTTPTVLVDQTAPRKDVVFLLDGSDYTRNAFPAMKDFVQRVVEKLNVMENRDRVSVVQYSRDPEAHLYLNTYTGKEETLDAVRALRHKGGRPLNTGAALQYVRDSAFSPSSGSRRQEGVPQILILLSGARSSDNVDTPATSLKESGVLIFAIGTKNSSREVEKISSDPTYAQSVSDFSELPNVQQQFLASVNTAVLEVTQTSPPVLG